MNVQLYASIYVCRTFSYCDLAFLYKNLVQYVCHLAAELRNTVYFGSMPPNESFSSDAAEMDIHSKTDCKCKVIFCYIAPASRFLENFNKQKNC